MVRDGWITVSFVLYHKTHTYIDLYEERSLVSSLLYVYGFFSLSLVLRKKMARLSQKMKRPLEVVLQQAVAGICGSVVSPPLPERLI